MPKFITYPTRATAARATLLRQAAQLRQRAGQGTASFTTNARSRRRVVVQGLVRFSSSTLPPAGVRQQPWEAENTVWRHVTRYRRNGRVLEKYRLRMGNKALLTERRLDGAVTWLSIPAVYALAMGLARRHHGLYLRTGYVALDKDEYILPRPLL